MSITDELRGWLKSLYTPNSGTLRAEGMAIADRIDEEHESKVQQAHADGLNEQVDFHDNFIPSNFMLLPVDAEGVPIHIGDVMEFTYDPPQDQPMFEVSGFGAKGTLFYAARGEIAPRKTTLASVVRHHAPTVEDVLREFADRYLDYEGMPSAGRRGVGEALMDEYAEKLQLRGEGE